MRDQVWAWETRLFREHFTGPEKPLTNVRVHGVKPIAGSLSCARSFRTRSLFFIYRTNPVVPSTTTSANLRRIFTRIPVRAKHSRHSLPSTTSRNSTVRSTSGTQARSVTTSNALTKNGNADVNTGSTTVAVRLPERLSSTLLPPIHVPPSGLVSNTASTIIFTGTAYTGSTTARR